MGVNVFAEAPARILETLPITFDEGITTIECRLSLGGLGLNETRIDGLFEQSADLLFYQWDCCF